MSKRFDNIGPKPWFYYLLVASLNSFFIYLVTLEALFSQLAIFSLSIALFMIIKKELNLRMIEKRFRQSAVSKNYSISVDDLFSLVKSYLRINRKNILIASVAIIIPTIIFSQVSIVYTTQQQRSLDLFLNNSDTSAVRINFQDVSIDAFNIWEEYFQNQNGMWLSDSEFKPLQSYTYGIISFKLIMGERFNFDYLERWIDFISIDTQQWTKESYELLSTLPTFPNIEFNSNESIMVLPVNLSGGNLGVDRGTTPGEAIPPKSYTLDEFIVENDNNRSEFNILVDSPYKNPVEDFVDPFLNMTHSVDHIWQLSYQDINYIDTTKINLPGSFTSGSLFVAKYGSLGLLENLNNFSIENKVPTNIWGEFGMETVIFTTIPTIKNQNPRSFLASLDVLTNTIGISISKSIDILFPNVATNIPIQIFSPLRERYSSFWENVSALDYIYLVTVLPLLLLSVYLFYFSQILSRRSYERNWRNMAMRGATPLQIRSLVISEAIIVSLSSSGIGFVLSLIFSNISLGSFNISSLFYISKGLIIPPSLLWRLPLIGFAIILNFSLGKLMNISHYYFNSKSTDDNIRSEGKNREPMLLLLSVTSIIYWVLRLNGQETRFSSNPELFRQLDVIFFVGLLIGIPVFLALQFSKTISRLMPLVKMELLIIAMKNLQRHKNFINHLIIIIFTSMMITSTTLIVDHSINLNEIERGRYSNGSDIMIDDINIYNREEMAKLNIKGVLSITQMEFFEYELSNWELKIEEEKENNFPYFFVGVNTTSFVETAFWSEEYADNDLKSIIKNIETPGSVAVDTYTKKRLNLEKNSSFFFNFGLRGTNELKFLATTFFDLYPNVVEDSRDLNTKNFIVGSLFTLEFIAFATNSIVDKRVYLKIDPAYDLDEITEQLRQIYGGDSEIKIFSRLDARRTIFSNLDEGNDLVTIEEDILKMMTRILRFYSFFITFLVLIYYSLVINNTREKEFAIYQILGATQIQKARIIIQELAIITFYIIFFAFVSSLFLSEVLNFILIDSGGNVIPPFRLIYPILKLLGTVFVYLIIILTTTLTTGYFLGKKQAVGFLRGG